MRVEYPGAIYQVMSRGGRREPIFQDDADRQRFVDTVGEACIRSGWQGPASGGEERQESQATKAERVVAEELRRRGWTETTLGQRQQGDVEEVKLALRWREETLVPVAWIAARLRMGSVAKVNTLLYRWRSGKGKSKQS